jgi:hypothetical protein
MGRKVVAKHPFATLPLNIPAGLVRLVERDWTNAVRDH